MSDKSKIIFFICLIFSTIAMSESLVSTFYSSHGKYTGRIEINLDETAAVSGAALITTENIDLLTDALGSNANMAYISEMDSIARLNDLASPVSMVLSSPGYVDFTGLEIVRGSFFSAESCKYGQNVAVISEKLAKELFKSYDILGEEFELAGQQYMVTGIYRIKSSIISLLGSDGAQRVYVPYESLNQPVGAVIKTIMIHDDDIASNTFREREVANTIRKNVIGDPDTYRITDFYNSEILSQYIRLVIFLTGLSLCCFIAAWLFRHIRKCFVFLRHKTRDMYFSEVLKAEKWFIVKSALTMVAAAGCIALIWSAIKFRLYIPPEFVPQDNIFDIRFYVERIADTIALHNSSFGYIPSQYEIDFTNVLRINVFLALCLTAEVLLAVSSLKAVRFTVMNGLFPQRLNI